MKNPGVETKAVWIPKYKITKTKKGIAISGKRISRNDFTRTEKTVAEYEIVIKDVINSNPKFLFFIIKSL